MTPKKTISPAPGNFTADPESISRAIMQKRMSDLENDLKQTLSLRDQHTAKARELDILGVRIEGAIQVIKEMLAPAQEVPHAE